MSPRGSEGSEQQARRDIVEVIRRVYARGWISATDGNVSILLGPDRVLATPTGINKGSMTPEDLIVVDRQGSRIQGSRPPSSDTMQDWIEKELATARFGTTKAATATTRKPPQNAGRSPATVRMSVAGPARLGCGVAARQPT